MEIPFARLPSHEDASVNFVTPCADGGFFEARLVQRTIDKPICYLSSHSGCAYSCRFCHLTATGQVMMTPATMEDYLAQAQPVIEEYRRRMDEGMPAGNRMNFNFMARGEPLANPVVLGQAGTLFQRLGELAADVGLLARFKISSIIPRDFDGDLSSVLADPRSQLYYSLYSLDPAFRKRWLPKAMDPAQSLDLIARWQEQSLRPIVLHWAFIQGQNDSMDQVDAILDEVEARGIRARFNLVRYNPHSPRHGAEPSEQQLAALFERIQARLDTVGPGGSKIIPRVGRDVSASCGMFVEAGDQRLQPQLSDCSTK